MVCVFFGHRDASEKIRSSLKAAIMGLLSEDDCVEFIVGNNGGFDAMVQRELREIKKGVRV